MKTEQNRRYGGASQEERIAARREKLMQTAADLYARQGPAGASVTAICAAAGLTPRYFYESFPNREALLLAVFERVCDRLIEQITVAIDARDRAGSVLRRFLSLLDEHPELTRMFFVDFHHQDHELRRMGFALADRLAGMLAPDTTSPIARAGIAGAVMRVSRAWIEGGSKEPVETVIALARRFVEAGSA
jgi:AcrR family transcriptional regulator